MGLSSSKWLSLLRTHHTRCGFSVRSWHLQTETQAIAYFSRRHLQDPFLANQEDRGTVRQTIKKSQNCAAAPDWCLNSHSGCISIRYALIVYSIGGN